jgi:hypothetical protein
VHGIIEQQAKQGDFHYTVPGNQLYTTPFSEMMVLSVMRKGPMQGLQRLDATQMEECVQICNGTEQE